MSGSASDSALELGARVIRGVRRRWPRQHTSVFEIAYDRNAQGRCDPRARRTHDGVRRIAVAIDLPLLITKRVKLPALSAAERRNILLLEPERFFADRSLGLCRRSGPTLTSCSRSRTSPRRVGPRARAHRARRLIEPAPVSLARALGHVGITDGIVALATGAYMELATVRSSPRGACSEVRMGAYGDHHRAGDRRCAGRVRPPTAPRSKVTRRWRLPTTLVAPHTRKRLRGESRRELATATAAWHPRAGICVHVTRFLARRAVRRDRGKSPGVETAGRARARARDRARSARPALTRDSRDRGGAPGAIERVAGVVPPAASRGVRQGDSRFGERLAARWLRAERVERHRPPRRGARVQGRAFLVGDGSRAGRSSIV